MNSIILTFGEISYGRVVEDIVNLIDVTPTVLEASEIDHPREYPMSGKSLISIFQSDKSGVVDSTRDATFVGRERHSSARWNHLGYPQRAIRTDKYLYIRNFSPERWPAGSPRRFEGDNVSTMHDGYHDIDTAPTLDIMIENADDPMFNRYLYLSVSKRPAEELYDIQNDPGCVNNLALNKEYKNVTSELRERLRAFLESTDDPRVTEDGAIWESYPRLQGPMREFPAPEWSLPDTYE